MRKLLLLILLASAPIYAQTHHFPATDTNNTFTGNNTFSGNVLTKLVRYTVSTLPSPGSTMNGEVVTVTDALTYGSCTAGSGTFVSLCYNTGSAWLSLNATILPNPFSQTQTGNATVLGTYSTFSTGSNSPLLYLKDGTALTPQGLMELSTTRTSAYNILTLANNDPSSSAGAVAIHFENDGAGVGGASDLVQEGSGSLYLAVTNTVGHSQYSFGPDSFTFNPATSAGAFVIGSADGLHGGFDVLAQTGDVSIYGGVATAGNGEPVNRAVVDLTAQGAAVGTTTLYAVPAAGAGQYRISWNAKVTTVDGVSSTLGALTVTWTDPDGVAQSITAPAAITAGTIATTSAGNVTTTKLIGLPLMLNAKASTNIQYAMAYVSNTPTQMKYNLHIVLEAQ